MLKLRSKPSYENSEHSEQTERTEKTVKARNNMIVKKSKQSDEKKMATGSPFDKPKKGKKDAVIGNSYKEMEASNPINTNYNDSPKKAIVKSRSQENRKIHKNIQLS